VGPIASMPKPAPIAQTYRGCPASGDGGDPALNTLKNRIDEATWQPVSVSSILSLTWPSSIERQPRSNWSKQDKEFIAQYEGAPVQAEGYLADAKKQGPESCNCHAVDQIDFHLWLVDDTNKGREQSVVVEVSPRVGAAHPAWSLTNIRKLVTEKQKVRISGWLMMDPEHPDQVGKTRATIWEIHPIMQIETQSGGTWKPLDNGTTGVTSAQVAAVTAPAATPEATDTNPPAGNAEVQDNKTVQITGLNANGKKGSAEPDEYVEITNNGTQPVDITDWTLLDTSGSDVYKWESYVLQPQASIRVYTNEVHDDSGGFSFNSLQAIWRNAGDVAELDDADGQLVSRFAYGDKK